MSRERAGRVKLVLFDVDGVMTDGKIWIFPAPGGGLVEAKGFHAHDGAGISLLRHAGIKTGLITKRQSETVALRARDLKMDYVLQGIHDKRSAFFEILKKEQIAAEDACFVGDDLIDLPVLRVCGFAVAVQNARPEVKRVAHFVTPHSGGDGAVRDAVEYVLKAQGRWVEVFESYIALRGDGGAGSREQ
jgi:3-deoxy-D-manno-octulosonate 8-phosphate phosphatase (KDO 8-P phosphatase)